MSNQQADHGVDDRSGPEPGGGRQTAHESVRVGPSHPSAPEPQPPLREVVVLTGMSGAGRSTAANVLEDLGWYVVDNLPPQMLQPLAELARAPGVDLAHLAVVMDVRGRGFFAAFQDGLRALRQEGLAVRVVFMDSTDEALVRRFESVRRPHPLQGRGRLLDAIVAERARLGDLRSEADVILDTSGLNVHQLSAKVSQLFAGTAGRIARLRIAVMSFGFKYGIPLDADLVLDLRFLPNPFWVPSLRALTGQDREVRDFVLRQEGAAEFVDGVLALMRPMAAGYQREGRRYVTLAVGCTGGKHRSVAIAAELADALDGDGVETILVHRDLGRE